MTVDLDAVVRLLQDTAEQVVNPRFQALKASEVQEKKPGDLVTEADREAEVLITAGLHRLDPGAVVVGEEAVAADPGVADLVSTADRVWLVDPVDGTANFVDGSPDHAVMAALLERGETVAAVIWQPQLGALWTAERGGGAWRDGERLPPRPPLPRDPAELCGALASTYLPPDVRAAVDANAERFGTVGPAPKCCGVSYPRLVSGEDDFALFWKTAPWDHAPGSLLVEECGGAVRRWDGARYRPDSSGDGLLVVADAAAWDDVRQALLAGL